jgi:hypothetical protein
MTLVTLPQMVVNFNGGNRTVGLFTLDGTTLGHIAVDYFYIDDSDPAESSITRLFANTPVPIPFTSCGENATACTLDRNSLAMWYSISDLAAMGWFYIYIYIYIVLGGKNGIEKIPISYGEVCARNTDVSEPPSVML